MLLLQELATRRSLCTKTNTEPYEITMSQGRYDHVAAGVCHPMEKFTRYSNLLNGTEGRKESGEII